MRTALAARHGVERHVARWEELLEDDGAGRRQRRRADVPARADHGRGARARAARAVGEADRAHAGGGGERWSRPRAAPGACSTSRSTTASAGTSRRCKRVIDAGRLGRAVLREGVVAAADRHPDARQLVHERRARRAAGRCWTSASTCSTTRCSCSGSRAITAVSASTYDLLGSAGFGSSPEMEKSGATGAKTFDVEDLATVFMRLDGRRHAAGRGRAGPRTARPATSSGSRSSAPRAAPS